MRTTLDLPTLPWGRAYHDEFHEAKGVGTAAVGSLQGDPYTWAVGGTPVTNGPANLVGYLSILEGDRQWAKDPSPSELRNCTADQAHVND